MAKKETKTNAMRILEQLKIPYDARTYECKEFVDGLQIADSLGIPREIVFKTLVTMGKSKNYYVFVIPVAEEIDFKKAAKAVGEKSLEMLHLKELTNVTGYVRGGCTAIGMKKKFVTVLHNSAESLEKITVSGGRIGLQLTLTPADFCKAAQASCADVIKTTVSLNE